MVFGYVNLKDLIHTTYLVFISQDGILLYQEIDHSNLNNKLGSSLISTETRSM